MKTQFLIPLALAATLLTAQPVFAQTIDDLFQQGDEAQANGGFVQAEEIFRRAVVLDPNNSDAYVGIGIALDAQGRVDEAISNFQTAIRLDPNNSYGYSNLGIALAEQGNVAEAAANFQTAIRLNPSNAYAYNGLGIIWVSQGNLEEAIAHFQAAIELEGANPDFQKNLQEAERLLAEQSEARP